MKPEDVDVVSTATRCRLARPIFIEEEMHSNVACLLAETLLKMVLTFQRNTEIVRTYEKATKGRHETAHVLRYVPQADERSNMIRTADVLRFVTVGQDAVYKSEKVRERGGGEPADARGSSHHTCMVASTRDTEMMNKSMLTPSAHRFTRRNEFNLIKSHEKEALFLSERFGDRLLDSTGGRNLAGSTLVMTGTADPGFAPEVLHLSKGKIDQSVRFVQGSK